MKTRWTIVANTVTAKIYANNPEVSERLILVKEFNHPEGLKRKQDLISDRPGHYQTSHKTRGSYDEHDVKEIENIKYTKQISDFLEHARKSNEFQSIVLIGVPHFLGMLEKHFSKYLQGLIEFTIHKNLLNLTEQQLTEIICARQIFD